MKPRPVTCCIPGCRNVPEAYGACRKHKRAVAPLVRAQQDSIPAARPMMHARITNGAKAKLESAAKALGKASAYKVASLVLERITPDDIAKYLKPDPLDGET